MKTMEPPSPTDLKMSDPERIGTAGSDGSVDSKGSSTIVNVSTSTPSADGTPDGGAVAWMQVLGAFLIYFNTWGLIASYGPFQTSYENDQLKGYTSFTISTIGSVQSFLMVFLGFIVGPIYDAGYFRHLVSAGSLLIVTGAMLQSIATNYWQLMLAQGICIGFGAGCLVIPSVAITSLWFTSRLPLANGIATAGSGVGGIVYPIIFRALEPHIGFGWSVRIVGLIALVTLGVANIVLKVPERMRSGGNRRPLVDKSAFSDAPYLLFVVGCFVVLLGMYSPFVYVGGLLKSFEKTGTSQVSAYIVAFMNLSSIFGRILPNFFAQKLGAMNMMMFAAVALGISAFCLTAVNGSIPAVFTVSMIYGFFTGTFFALQATIFVRLTPDKRFIGTRFGMAFSVLAFALLFGPPISGAFKKLNGYDGAWYWVGVVVLEGAIVIGISRIHAAGWNLRSV